MAEMFTGKVLINDSVITGHLKLGSEMKVGDFGCGSSGYFLLPIAEAIGENGLVYGVDVQKSALESIDHLSKQKGLCNVKTVWSDLEVYKATKIPEGSLDRGVLINVLFQTKDDASVLKEVARLLKIGALLLIVDWKDEKSSVGPPLERRVKKEHVRSICESMNMAFVEEFDPGPYHYGLVFEKRF